MFPQRFLSVNARFLKVCNHPKEEKSQNGRWFISLHHKDADSIFTSQDKQTLQRIESLFRMVSDAPNLINLCIDNPDLKSEIF